MASDLEKCAVTFFHAHKGFGVAIRPDGISVFLPGPVAGVYEKGDIRRAYIGERLPAPIGGDTVLCRTEPNPRPNPKYPNALAATMWALLITNDRG